MIVMLKLNGMYTPKGRCTEEWAMYPRVAAVDLDIREERRGIVVRKEKDDGRYLGLMGKKGAWWRVSEIYELYNPTEVLVADMYPCGGYMSQECLMEILEGYRRNRAKGKGKHNGKNCSR